MCVRTVAADSTRASAPTGAPAVKLPGCNKHRPVTCRWCCCAAAHLNNSSRPVFEYNAPFPRLISWQLHSLHSTSSRRDTPPPSLSPTLRAQAAPQCVPACWWALHIADFAVLAAAKFKNADIVAANERVVLAGPFDPADDSNNWPPQLDADVLQIWYVVTYTYTHTHVHTQLTIVIMRQCWCGDCCCCCAFSAAALQPQGRCRGPCSCRLTAAKVPHKQASADSQ